MRGSRRGGQCGIARVGSVRCEARLAERSRQLDLIPVRRGRKGKQARAEILAAMLIAEALADCIADGDVASLGVREADLFQILTENV